MNSVDLIYVLCEGHTEKAFVSQFLIPHFANRQKTIQPILLSTSRDEDKSRQGGISKYSYIRNDILRFLRTHRQNICVTTMIDFHGLPKDFPGNKFPPKGDPYVVVRFLEKAFGEDIQDERFYPYLMLHEFEALVLVQPEKLREVLPLDSSSKRNVEKLIRAVSGYRSPEEINDDPNKHPSARLREAIQGYSKLLHGLRVIEAVGLGAIREKCPHFGEWLTHLEGI